MARTTSAASALARATDFFMIETSLDSDCAAEGRGRAACDPSMF